MATTETTDFEHDFEVTVDGKFIANVWHSDRGEWTVDTVDGPTFKERTRAAAIERAETWAKANA